MVKTTSGLANIASSDAVISPRADYGVTASKAKANTRARGGQDHNWTGEHWDIAQVNGWIPLRW